MSISELNRNFMENGFRLYVSGARYLLFILMAAYTYLSFRYFWADEAGKKRICRRQLWCLFPLHLIAYTVIGFYTRDPAIAVFYGLQAVFFLCYSFLYRVVYPRASRLLINHTCMLLCVGLIMLTRLNYNRALRQFLIVVLSALAACVLPWAVGRLRGLSRFPWFYGLTGLALLTVVCVAGNTSFGAQLSLTFGGVSLQPSEFVKILFVLFAAAQLSRSVSFSQIAVTTVLAALHVLVLVLSKDLGGALLFFTVYLFMLYAATSDWKWLAAGAVSGCGAAVAGYRLFSHVRSRVLAWRDPWSDIDDKGYQITQSLFAIGTGGWFGLGLYEGMPGRIPVVEKDFIFAAVSEELGALFAICLLFICLCCFMEFLRIAGRTENMFYKLTAFGLGCMYIVQVFLTVGGVVKFIPSTGVTLPLVSYGGSSVLSTFILFGILQGLCAMGSAGEIETARKRKNLKLVPKKETKRSGGSASMRLLARLILAAFAAMIAYETWFLTVRREDVINNSYNRRLDDFAQRVTRGRIVAHDGTILAETLTDEEGKEVRSYPYGSLFSHVVGYSTIGKTGIEDLAHFYLLSSHVNPLKAALTELTGRKNPGDTVVTTLDLQLQQTAWEALGDRRGAVVVMEPDTGKILAMVSRPDFDPNTAAGDWETLTSEDNESGQLLNRAAQGLYPPGSTFKIVTLLEYIRRHPEDYGEFQYDCGGSYTLDGAAIRCYHGTAHGRQTLAEAFANSCNGAFAKIGSELEIGAMTETVRQLLFNAELPVAIPYSGSSYVLEEDAPLWERLQTAIGQGRTQITPLHNALLVSAIANGGTLMQPCLIDRIENADGKQIRKFMPQAYGNLMTAEEAALLAEMMTAVVTDGTGSALVSDAYTAAGKTGSAEFARGKETHAWFVGFAPARSPRLAVSVLVEEGGSGGKTAAPIAKKIFDAYFAR